MAEDTVKNLDAYDIQQYQQNRYPCFFLDYVEETVPEKSAKVTKILHSMSGFSQPIFLMNLMSPVLFKLSHLPNFFL